MLHSIFDLLLGNMISAGDLHSFSDLHSFTGLATVLMPECNECKSPALILATVLMPECNM